MILPVGVLLVSCLQAGTVCGGGGQAGHQDAEQGGGGGGLAGVRPRPRPLPRYQAVQALCYSSDH